MNKSNGISKKLNIKDSALTEKNIYEVSYSLLGGGSIEVEATGPEQAAQSVQTISLEILIANTDFKNGLEIHQVSKERN